MYKQAGPTVYRRILYLVFLKCVLFQKKKEKKRATNAFIEDFLLKTIPGNNEELLIKMFYEETYSELFNNAEDRRASLSEGALNAFPTFGSKTRD